MAIDIRKLSKGENAVLNATDWYVGLGWDVREDSTSSFDFDLDVSAFMLNAKKKLFSDDYLVFYNTERRLLKKSNGVQIVDVSAFSSNEEMRQTSRPVDPECSVIGSIDDEDGATSEDGDDETIDIFLSKVRPEVEEIVITVSIHEADERRQNFGQVERAYVRLYKPGQGEGEGEYLYDLSEDFSTSTAVEFCRIYRHGKGWKVQATGTGHRGGLLSLLNKYQ